MSVERRHIYFGYGMDISLEFIGWVVNINLKSKVYNTYIFFKCYIPRETFWMFG